MAPKTCRSVSKSRGWLQSLFGVVLALFLLAVVIIATPIALLTYRRARIHDYCDSIRVGEPIAQVLQRGSDEGFTVFDAKPLSDDSSSADAGSPDTDSRASTPKADAQEDALVYTDFMLAHLLCDVTYDGGKVVKTSYDELW